MNRRFEGTTVLADPLLKRVRLVGSRNWWPWLFLLALAVGSLAALRLAAPAEDTAEAHLLALLQQNTDAKYLAALAAVQADALNLIDGRRAIISHEVVPGDTLASLAAVYGLQVTSLAASNQLEPDARLVPGQKLVIPPVDGLVYRVQERDTLAAIAERFGVSATSIAQATGPNLQDFVTPGQALVIPGDAELLARRSQAPTPTVAAALRSSRFKVSDRGYVWPVSGYVGSPYGMRHGRPHRGIDIVGPAGSPVAAVREGKVIFAGWMSGGFGNTVDIRHDNGLVSRYAHLSRVFATVGQPVEAGQAVGARGCTGRCTGPHLHFEMHQNGEAVNPLPFLR